MDRGQIEAAVRKIISEKAELPIDFDAATRFQELNIDSLLFVEIMSAAEKQYRARIPEQRYPELKDLNGVVNVLMETLGPR